MAEVKFTKEQQAVIDARDCNILVSAAAGSGKTAVLVERIIRMIEKDLDVDHLLVVTFTKAAASQMKEKITKAIQEELSKDPENGHLQKQETLIHNAQITTIDSFCQYIIRNNFNAIGLDPSFRVGDEGELKLLQEEVMAELMEDEYEAAGDALDSDFLFCMDYFATGSSDKKVEEYINQLFKFSMSMPFPDDWIKDRGRDYEAPEGDFDELPWVKECVTYAKRVLKEAEARIDSAIRLCLEPDGPYMNEPILNDDKASIEAALKYDTYDALFDGIRGISFARLSGKKDPSVNADKREQVKDIRDGVKKSINGLMEKYFALTSGTIISQMELCDRAVKELCRLTLEFKSRFDNKKREKQLIDFADMEHFALDILVEHPSEDECRGLSAQEILDICRPSVVALEYREFFKEVLIDEYQDSNNVQEMILKAISGEKADISERFMVGDVKQSIYKFRLARPEIFMDKLGRYSKEADATDKRIDLHNNFRSRIEVLDGTNYIFRKIMGDDLGGVDYDEDALLRLGNPFDDPVYDVTPELIMLDGKDVLDADEADEVISEMTGREKEALAVAQRIHALRWEKPDLQYKDIVILLRSLSGWDDVFKDVLESQGIPTYIESKSGYFEATEVSVLLDLLSVIDNPRQDIPLVAVMHSLIGGFSDEELARIRVAMDKCSEKSLSGTFYEGLKILSEMEDFRDQDAFCGLDEALLAGIKEFLTMIDELRTMATYTPVHELLQIIIDRTDYEAIVTAQPAGNQRRANIELLLTNAANFEKTSFKGLFHFVRYIEHLKTVQVDYGEAGIIDENADVVRIMSIHKSKGLEFPVVFVSGLSKEMNFRDSQGDLITDMDLGIGVKCINTELRVKYDTLKRQVIASRMNMESLGEEIRVLYVALTRAKEKLILTAFEKDLAKSLNAAIGQIPAISGGDRLLPYSLRGGAKSYFDLVLPALIRHPALEGVLEKYQLNKDVYQDKKDTAGVPAFHFTALGEKDLKENGVREALGGVLRREELRSVLKATVDAGFKGNIANADKHSVSDNDTAESQEISESAGHIANADEYWDLQLCERLRAKFYAEYAHNDLKGLFTKTSVSELKKKSYVEETEISAHEAPFAQSMDAQQIFAEPEKGDLQPDGAFVGDAVSTDGQPAGNKTSHGLTGAERGTAYHRIMELLDGEIYGDESLMEKAREGAFDPVSKKLYAWGMKKASEGWLSPEEQRAVWTPDITAFLATDLGRRMGEAFRRGELMREKPFMMGVPADELDPKFPKEEMVLVQGIIDAWFIEGDDLVLLDYKTDRVEEEKTLVDRYRVQLDLYKRALEAATCRKVKEVYIYSFALSKAIEL